MRVVITNIALVGRSGTELVTAEIARRLSRQGASVAIYATRREGPVVQALASQGIVVADRIAALANFAPDLIHGHHNTPFLVARAAFPAVPAVWCCHDYGSPWDRPPAAASAQLFVAHSDQTALRMEREGAIPRDRIRILPNAADLEAFPPAPAEAPPNSVLIVGKSTASTGGLPAVAEALRGRGFHVTCVGPGLGPTVADLAPLMAAHRIVVSSGRVALEALAVGRAVVCADGRGLAGLVTPATLPFLRRRNFGGAAMLRDLDPDAVLAEIAALDEAEQQALAAMLRPEIGLDLYMDRLNAIHAEAIALAGNPASAPAIHGAETLEAMIASARIGGFGPDQAGRVRDQGAVRIARLEAQSARLSLRLRLAMLKPGGRLTVTEWLRDAGSALLGQGWRRVEPGRMAIAGRGMVEIAEAVMQRRLARIVVHLERLGGDAAEVTAIDAMDGAELLASAPVQDGVATIDLALPELVKAGLKAFALQPRGGSGETWAVLRAELVAQG